MIYSIFKVIKVYAFFYSEKKTLKDYLNLQNVAFYRYSYFPLINQKKLSSFKAPTLSHNLKHILLPRLELSISEIKTYRTNDSEYWKINKFLLVIHLVPLRFELFLMFCDLIDKSLPLQ